MENHARRDIAAANSGGANPDDGEANIVDGDFGGQAETSLARSSDPTANLGSRGGANVHRSRMVLRLVSYILVAKGIELRSGLIAVWVPFIAADLGNFFGGGVSGYLVKKGWSLGASRKAVVVFGGIGVTLLIPTIFTTNLYLIAALFALSTFSYAAFSTMANVLPSDLYPSESVATVSGLGGTGSGLATIVAFYLIGHYSDVRKATTTQFDPIVIVAGLIPLAGMIIGVAPGAEYASYRARIGSVDLRT
jgi:hypothetical protein